MFLEYLLNNIFLFSQEEKTKLGRHIRRARNGKNQNSRMTQDPMGVKEAQRVGHLEHRSTHCPIQASPRKNTEGTVLEWCRPVVSMLLIFFSLL